MHCIYIHYRCSSGIYPSILDGIVYLHGIWKVFSSHPEIDLVMYLKCNEFKYQNYPAGFLFSQAPVG